MTPQKLAVSDAMRPQLTVAGLIEMVTDLAAQGVTARAIFLHPTDAGDIRNELNDHGTDPDNKVLAIICNAPVIAHPDVKRGTARIG